MTIHATVASDTILGPRAGTVACFAVTTSAASQDIRALAPSGRDGAAAGWAGVASEGRFFEFHADGADVYFILGQGTTNAGVTGANAPVIATTGVSGAGIPKKLVKDQPQSFYLIPGVDNWIGFIGSAAGYLRITPSSV